MSRLSLVAITRRQLTSQLVKNAAVYPFVNDGFPIVYMGQEHGLMGGEDPFNREAIWLQGYHQTSVGILLILDIVLHNFT
jgi:glycosidase